MRIALISDIHGNGVGLEAVLDDIRKARIDRMICLGDVATLGPQPHEVTKRLRELNCPGITGNHETDLFTPERSQKSVWAETFAWCREQLTDEDKAYLQSFQPMIEIPLGDDKRLLCFHGSPKANTDFILPTTPDDELNAMLTGQNAIVMAGGHTHVQMMRRHHRTMIINTGSVGIPFHRYFPTFTETRFLPHAEYAIVDSVGAINIEFRRVPIDFATLEQASAGSSNPFNWMPYWFRPDEQSAP
ncbi:MAG: metallophosphatase family protein [Anaerolineae bacterium]|nr:metallophosphatase family protein [Anaerolineae bacterium]